jgi:AcrR family transcriptional regulator
MAHDAKNRILDTASKLFYEDGIQNVGIDRIVKESSVAKMTLYKYFNSKNELIASFLDYAHDKWRVWFLESLEEHNKRCQNRIQAYFLALHDWVNLDDFRGCPFINSVVELAQNTHPGAKIAQDHRAYIRDYLSEQIRLEGVKFDSKLAEKLLILMDGAIIGALMGKKDAAMLAGDVALTLMQTIKGGMDQ